MSEERRREILENRRTFQRLSRDVVEGKRRKEVIPVSGRDGTQYEVEVHALSELAIARAAQVTGLSLGDLSRRQVDAVTDEKGLAKLQFVDEIVASALVGDESQRLSADELAEILPGSERARVFNRVLELSGFTSKARADVEKFQPESPQRSTSDAGL